MATSRAVWKALVPILVILAIVFVALSTLKSRFNQPGDLETASNVLDVGSTVPDFTLHALGGESSPVSGMKAKVMLLNFWATWCEACMVEMPSIVKLRQDFKDKGFEVLAVNVDENPEAVVPRALKKLGIDFPVYVDKEGKLADLFDVHAIPLSILIDRQRKILFIESGERNWSSTDIRGKLEKWLAG